MSLLPRWMHRLYAFLARYFWLPCPLCGRYFGGHEWKSRKGLPPYIPHPTSPTGGRGICPRCTREGRGWTDSELLARRVAMSTDHKGQTGTTNDNGPVRGWEELRSSGLLWLINKAVLHPRGYAIAVVYQGDQAMGWQLLGDGSEQWEFANDTTHSEFAAVEALFAAHRKSVTADREGISDGAG